MNAPQRTKAHYVNDIVTPVALLDWHNLYKAVTSAQYPLQGPKYDVTILIPKMTNGKPTDLSALKKGHNDCKALAWPGLPNKDYPDWKCLSALKDGDKPPLPGKKAKPDYYKGHWYLTARANAGYPPLIVGRDKKDIPESEGARTFHRGCEVRCKLTAQSWEINGQSGVSFRLEVVQWVGVGEFWSGANTNGLDDLPDDGGGLNDGADVFNGGNGAKKSEEDDPMS